MTQSGNSGIKVLITDGMAENGLEALKAAGCFDLDVRKGIPKEELAEIIGNYESIVIRSATTLTKDLIEKATSMKLIVRAGAGVDNIDVPTASEKKIPVMNTASANSLAAAEQTIALIFSTLRHVPQAQASLKAGKWDRNSFKGREVTGKVLGIIGLGNIGRIVAEKAVGLGMKVIGFDPAIREAQQIPTLSHLTDSLSVVTNLDELITRSDLISIHVPKTPKTTHLVNQEFLSKMKKGSFFINCARGGVVDEKAVIEALDSGHLEGAAFDVFEKEPPEFPNPIFEHDKIIATPHLGAMTFEAQTRVASTAAEQMIGFFKNNETKGIINQ